MPIDQRTSPVALSPTNPTQSVCSFCLRLCWSRRAASEASPSQCLAVGLATLCKTRSKYEPGAQKVTCAARAQQVRKLPTLRKLSTSLASEDSNDLAGSPVKGRWSAVAARAANALCRGAAQAVRAAAELRTACTIRALPRPRRIASCQSASEAWGCKVVTSP